LSTVSNRHHFIDVIEDVATSHDYFSVMLVDVMRFSDVALLNSIMVKRQLDDIRAMGLNVSMDDFGAGYSKLSFIRDLHLSAIKIDKTFIMDFTENPVNKAAKLICDAKKCEVVAEGIETVQQLNILKKLGISSGQGFLFSPAVKFDSFFSLRETGNFERLLADNIRTAAG
jgi:EAL domain-containing protein (putative c-di-GMP-specific phosphodiesterase class I)